MCGIAGIINSDNRSIDGNAISKMLDIINHRGPDHAGYWTEGNIALGCARLAIIGLDNGNQPIHSKDGRFTLVCNGEIYNYKELRSDLQKNSHEFVSSSDVEVLIHLYRERGLGFLDEVIGQFAFCLYDHQEGVSILGRDRTGISPLFYYHSDERFIFCSEIKGIFTHSEVPRSFDATSLKQSLKFWSAVPPKTFFKDIFQLPPAHLMIVKGGEKQIIKYWEQEFNTVEGRSHDDWKASVREAMSESVKLSLRSDVPVGLYLSGGIDSSILAILVHKYAGEGFRTFSVNFSDETFDESGFQAAMIDKIGADHTSLEITYDDVAKHFPRVVNQVEAPLFRTAPVPLSLLSGEVHKQGYKVVLSGEGADEVFWGYDTYRELFVRLLWSHMPDSLDRPALLQKIFPYFEQYKNPRNFAFLKGFYKKSLLQTDDPFYGLLPRWQTNEGLLDFLHEDIKNAPCEMEESLYPLLPDGFKGLDAFKRYQLVEMINLLAGYLLASQGDRMLMMNSVEGRFPFLNKGVTDIAGQLPNYLKCKGLKDKYILREAFRDDLPREIYERPKFAYRAPDLKSFFGGSKIPDYVQEMMSPEYTKSAGIFDVDKVNMLYKKASTGNIENVSARDNMAVTSIISTHLLHKNYLT